MVQRVGLVGCGHIAPTYLRNSRGFSSFKIVSCADQEPRRAEALALEWDLSARSVAQLLASADLDIVLNLTPAHVHYGITRAALLAGKHVYTEKPLATAVAEGRVLIELAAQSGRRLAIAPDTFLGPMVQQARAIVAAGTIGEIIHGVAAFMTPGMEAWHPNPAPFFRRGGGPMLDLGPYAVTALVAMLGPVSSVIAAGRIGRPQRQVLAVGSPHAGESFTVEVPTTVHATLLFASGTPVTLFGSFDTVTHNLPAFELFGVSGSLRMPSPHVFGGELILTGVDGKPQVIDTRVAPFGAPNTQSPIGMVADYRGLGLEDMARAIELNQPHQASAELGLHVLEILGGIDTSIERRERITIAAPSTTIAGGPPERRVAE